MSPLGAVRRPGRRARRPPRAPRTHHMARLRVLAARLQFVLDFSTIVLLADSLAWQPLSLHTAHARWRRVCSQRDVPYRWVDRRRSISTFSSAGGALTFSHEHVTSTLQRCHPTSKYQVQVYNGLLLVAGTDLTDIDSTARHTLQLFFHASFAFSARRTQARSRGGTRS